MNANSHSESELVKRALHDLDAFGELVERYRASICRQCRSFVHDPHYAEDLAQETFIRAYLKLSQLQDPERFPNWLRKIAANVCREFVRSPMRRESAWEIVPDPGESNVLAGDLIPHLDVLPDESRVCVELFYLRHLSYREIAEALGISVGSVRNRLHRARTLLREEMADMSRGEKSAFTARVIERLERLKNGTASERALAAGELNAALGMDRAEWMVSRLTQPDPMERSFFIRRSRRIHSPRVRDALVHILLNDEWEENRIKAASALVAQQDPSVISYLRQVMESPETPRDVGFAAKSALRQLEKSEPPGPDKVGALRKDISIAAVDRKSRLELLIRLKAALLDPQPQVRTRALRALGELGDKRAVPMIVKLLADPSPGIRQAAAQVLGKLKGKSAVSALARIARDSDDRIMLQSVVAALGEIGDPVAVPELISILDRTTDYTLVVFTMRAIESVSPTEYLTEIGAAVERLEERMPDKPIWGHWAGILAKAADERHVPQIVSELEKQPGNARLIEALGRIGDIRGLDILTRNLMAGNSRIEAAYALARLGEPGLDALREALRSVDPVTRNAATRPFVFAGVCDEAAFRILADLADNDPNSAVRFYAKVALFRKKRITAAQEGS